jgi:ferredoxin--NADP+ reductase
LIVSAIGYESEPVEGIPYSNGKVENVEGRVRGTNIYVVGWAKRGPSGVIGTNKSDSATVIEHLVSDLREPKTNSGIINLLKERGVVHISQSNWEKLNSAEVAAGTSSGKPRIKFIDRNEMLGFAD